MGSDPGAELAELLAAFDPDSIFRAIALALAVQTDTTKDHQRVLSVSASYFDFIAPFSNDDKAQSFTLKLEKK